MQNATNQDVLYRLNKELRRLFDGITVIPYSALPLEQPQLICFARRIEELTGYTADQILANRQLWMSVIHPADREQVFAAFTKCKNLGISFEIEYRIIHKDGSLRYVIDEGEPVFNDKGQVTEIEGIISDVSPVRSGAALHATSNGVSEYKKARICVCQGNPEATRISNVNSDVFQKI